MDLDEEILLEIITDLNSENFDKQQQGVVKLSSLGIEFYNEILKMTKGKKGYEKVYNTVNGALNLIDKRESKTKAFTSRL